MWVFSKIRVNGQKKKVFTFSRDVQNLLFVSLPIAILFNLILVGYIWNQLNTDSPLKFTTNAPQMKQYSNVQSLRQQLIFENPLENNVLSQSYPIVYKKTKNGDFSESFYGVRAEVKYIGPNPGYKFSANGYNGPVNLMFGRTNSAIFDISPVEYLYANVVNIRNYQKHGQELYACANFEIETISASYFVKVTQGCMFVEDLLYRWGGSSRQFRDSLPKLIPPEAHGANAFGLNFHREQPCHWSADYFIAHSPEIIYSVPLKDVTYRSNRDIIGREYLDLTGTYFDGSVLEMKKLSSTYVIKQSVKTYQETNRIYPLKMKIKQDTSINPREFNDADMWLQGAKFKYDVTSKQCYMINNVSVVLLNKDNAGFFVDRENIKLVLNLYNEDYIFSLKNEKYALLIKYDAANCVIFI